MTRQTSTWFEHAIERRWQPQRQVVALVMLGFVLALIFGGLYLSQVVSEATTNRRLESLLNQRDDLERENELLRVEIARLKSVPNLFARAQEKGFEPVDANRIEYLVVTGYTPVQVDTVAPITVITPETLDTYDETFTDWLSRQWDGISRTFQGLFGG
jgi:cell division protein FtsB